jgi:hypothetical protein
MKIREAFVWMVSISSLVFLCSCASFGTKFTPPSPDKLMFGKMTSEEALKLFGKPYALVNKTTTNGTYITYKYSYAQADPGSVNSRELLLEFKEDKLNGYYGWSSFGTDKSKFDPNIADKLRAGVGKLTKDEVAVLVGAPQGKALCPSVITNFKESCEKNTEVWGWYMSDNINLWVRKDVKSVELTVSFGADGKVSGVEMTQNTN